MFTTNYTIIDINNCVVFKMYSKYICMTHENNINLKSIIKIHRIFNILINIFGSVVFRRSSDFG